MLRSPYERRPAREPTGVMTPRDRPDLACRATQIGLTIYLSPIILLVLLIGGTAVLSENIARLAGRMIHGRSVRPVGHPFLTGMQADKRMDRATELAGRSGRSRTL